MKSVKHIHSAGRDLGIFGLAAALVLALASPALAATSQQAQDTLEVDVTIEDNGWANEITGKTTVTGEITCSRPAEIELSVELAQDRGDKTFRGFGWKTFDCNGTEQWQATARGDFKEGSAGVDVTAYSTEDNDSKATASRTLRLRACTIIGTVDDDVIRGTQRSDKICSISGNDVVHGGRGNDQLRGYDGNDDLFGGRGDDILNGGYGKDDLRGDAGEDTLYGDQHADTLDGGNNRDTCFGGAAPDRFGSCEKQQQ